MLNSTPIRTAWTPEGNIEACAYLDLSKRLVIDGRTGDVIQTTHPQGSDTFRHLARAARRFLAR